MVSFGGFDVICGKLASKSFKLDVAVVVVVGAGVVVEVVVVIVVVVVRFVVIGRRVVGDRSKR